MTGVEARQSEIDEKIGAHLASGWSLDRLERWIADAGATLLLRG